MPEQGFQRYAAGRVEKMTNKPNKKQFLPIKTKDVKRYIGYYENWYNTFDKDGYKYVIEQLSCDHNIDDKYYNNVLSSLHNFIKGGKFYRIEITK